MIKHFSINSIYFFYLSNKQSFSIVLTLIRKLLSKEMQANPNHETEKPIDEYATLRYHEDMKRGIFYGKNNTAEKE